MYDEYRQKVLPPMYKKYVEPSIKYADEVLDVAEMSKQDVLSKATNLILSKATTA
jgi:hypothetical protein